MIDPANNLHIAVFIDADNISHSKINGIYEELTKIGTVAISRAYGNWCMPGMDAWKKVMHTHAIQSSQQFNLTKSKNATDIEMAIGAMDALFTKSIDVFCIVSSDCDFMPLALRLRAQCKQVIGVGMHSAPPPYVNACTRFVFLDQPPAPSAPVPATVPKPGLPKKAKASASTTQVDEHGRPSGNLLKKNTELMNLLLDHLAMRSQSKGWARLSAMGELLASETTFRHQDYGYGRLCDFFEAINLFEVKRNQNGVWVRQRPAASPPPTGVTSAKGSLAKQNRDKFQRRLGKTPAQTTASTQAPEASVEMNNQELV
jgi:uncharacterized protein (TIGR00288 family)